MSSTETKPSESTPSAGPSTGEGSTANPSRAEYLKAEGNTFFLRKDYALAALKYTEALEVDEKRPRMKGSSSVCF